MTKLTLLAAASLLLIGAPAMAPVLAHAAPASAGARTAARLQYAGALTFSPDGVLFVGDNVSGAVFAYPMGEGATPAAAPPLEVDGINGR